MIKIPNIVQIREADQYTIKHEPVSSIDLMERASKSCFDWINAKFQDNKQNFVVFAGSGNNGGDGLAIARMLIEKGYPVNVFFVKLSDSISPDCETNLSRLKNQINVQTINSIDNLPSFAVDSIIIDSLLGSGISREPDGLVLKVIEAINAAKNKVISIDLPSGLFADHSSVNHKSKIVKADITLTIGAPKLALFMPESNEFCGDWFFIPIGLHNDYLEQLSTNNFFVEFSDFKNILPQRKKFSHKGTYGHALIMAGSKGKTGAAVLATQSCLRSGCGLTTIHCPASSLNIIQTAAPEAMVSVDKNENCISEIPDLNQFSAIAFGPGCSQNKATASALKFLIQETKVPLVIDADGLNILSGNKTWLAFLPKNTILTPHPKEFSRLFGETKNDFDRLDLAIKSAKKYGCIIILKGAYTSIITPQGHVFFNCSGNPGMATGGSGDVLTGLIVGLLSQGIEQLHAALLAVFLHGLSGDIAASELTQEAMKAGDLADYLPNAWSQIMTR